MIAIIVIIVTSVHTTQDLPVIISSNKYIYIYIFPSLNFLLRFYCGDCAA